LERRLRERKNSGELKNKKVLERDEKQEKREEQGRENKT